MHVTAYTMNELNQRINKSLEDIKAGQTMGNAEVERRLTCKTQDFPPNTQKIAKMFACFNNLS